jgi:hypothetical protein
LLNPIIIHHINTDPVEMKNKRIEFFIDAYGKDAVDYINEIASNIEDLEIVKAYEESSEVTFFHFKGTWFDYKHFIQREKVDLSLPENLKYKYSLVHYYED